MKLATQVLMLSEVPVGQLGVPEQVPPLAEVPTGQFAAETTHDAALSVPVWHEGVPAQMITIPGPSETPVAEVPDGQDGEFAQMKLPPMFKVRVQVPAETPDAPEEAVMALYSAQLFE